MSKTILIPGTGKMSLDIGLFLLKKDFKIIWISRDMTRLSIFRKKAEKLISRLKRNNLLSEHFNPPSFYLHDAEAIPPADIIIESINENIEEKKHVLSLSKPYITDNTLIFSNSSSILPDEINNRCIGMHFFYPIELTCFVEIILHQDITNQYKKKVLSFVKELEINHTIQNNNNAFIANRILLPIQAESFRLIKNGEDPNIIDIASSFDMLSTGQFSLINSVGLDTIYISLNNYIKRMLEKERKDYSIMQNHLKEMLLTKDKKKIQLNSHNTESDYNDRKITRFKKMFNLLFINTCLNIIESSLLTEDSLNFMLKNLFQIEKSFDEIYRKYRNKNDLEIMQNLYYKTAINYFKPSTLWISRQI